MKIRHFLNRLLQALSKKELLWIYAVLLITIILSLLGIHGSSIGTYHNYFYGSKVDKDLIYGQPRAIRSDEWIVTTPITISQDFNNYDRINTDIGLESDTAILYSQPCKHWSSVFKPSTLAFLFTGLETAFAFRWWFRGALLLISSYLFLMKLLNKNLLLSIGGSLLFFCTPFIQWWYSVEAIEPIAYMFFILYGFMKLFESRKLIAHMAWATFMSYFATCFILTLYPPFQVSIGLAGIFFVAGYALNNRKFIKKKKVALLGLSIAISILLTAATGLRFYQDLQKIINIIMQTTYPGQRIVTGGGFSVIQWTFGFFNILLQRSSNIVPSIFGNQSEASNFFMFYPWILLISAYLTIKNIIKKEKIDYILVFISAYLVLGTVWLFIGLPEILAKVTFLTYVPANRMIIGIGTMNYVVTLYFISKIKLPSTPKFKVVPHLLSLVTFGGFLILGLKLSSDYPEFFYAYPAVPTIVKLILIALVPSLCTLFLIQKNEKLFMAAIVCYAIASTFVINPLYKGLKVVTGTDVAEAIHSIESTNYENKRWVVFGSGSTANYLIANGANSINSTHWYPQLELWEIIDPEKQFFDIYNRYAHISFHTDSPDNFRITLPVQDCVDVYINPCDQVFEELGVQYYLFERQVEFSCLEEISYVNTPARDIYFYERSQ